MVSVRSIAAAVSLSAAVCIFNGAARADMSDPLSPSNPIGMLNPTSPLYLGGHPTGDDEAPRTASAKVDHDEILKSVSAHFRAQLADPHSTQGELTDILQDVWFARINKYDLRFLDAARAKVKTDFSRNATAAEVDRLEDTMHDMHQLSDLNIEVCIWRTALAGIMAGAGVWAGRKIRGPGLPPP